MIRLPTKIDPTELFLRELLVGVPEDLWGLLWTLRDKRSHWFRAGDGVEAISGAVRSLAATHDDVYIGVSVAEAARGNSKRIPAEASAGVFGVVAEIDVAHEVHAKSAV